MNYSIQLDFNDGNGFINCSDYLTATDFTKHTAINIDSHEQSTLNITFKADETLFRKLLNSGLIIKAKVLKDGTAYFTGIIRNTNSFDINEALQPFSFQIVDNTYLLKTKPTVEKSFYDNYVISNSDTANSIVHNILNEAGIENYEILIEKDFQLPFISLKTTATYASVLDTLFTEYGLAYSFKDDGTFFVTDLFPSTVVPSYVLTDTELLQPLTIEKQDIENDGVTITWQKASTKTDRYVFRQFSATADEQLILSGFYFPANAADHDNITYQTFSNIEDTEKELVHTSNPRIIFTAEEGIEIAYQEFFPLKARVYFENNATDNTLKYLYNFDIKADVVTLSEEYTHTITGDNIEEYTASYINSVEAAENLANIIKSRQENQTYKVNFSSKNNYNIGQNVRISDLATGIDLTIFIETKDETENNPVKSYTATSVGDITFVASKTITSVPSDQYSNDTEIEEITTKLEDLTGTVGTATVNITSIEENLLTITTRVATAENDAIAMAEDVSTQASTITANKTDIETALSTAQTELNNSITEAKSAITSVSSDVDEINVLNTAQGLSITKNANDITLKANQTEVDTLTGTVNSSYTLISQNADEIALKASSSSLNTTNGKVSSNTSAIGVNSSAITSAVSRITSAEGNIIAQGTDITQNADDITTKASTTALNTATGNISSNTASIGVNATAITSKVSQTSFNTLSGTVSTHGTEITQNATAITTKASTSALNTVDGKTTTNASAITQNATAITTVASRVSQTESDITANESSITQNATDITSAITRITQTESDITENTSSIQQNAESITQKVSFISSDGNLSNNATLQIKADATGSKIMLDADDVIIDGSIKATKIDVDNLMAEELIVGNKIQSVSYDDVSRAGFELTNEGTLTAKKALLKDVRIEVGDENDKLLWVQTGQDAGAITVSNSSSPRFSTSQYLSSYQSAVVFDGTSGKNSGSGVINLGTLNNSYGYINVIVEDTITIKFNLSYSTSWIGSQYKQSVLKNGVVIYNTSSSSTTYTHTFYDGDIIQVKPEGVSTFVADPLRSNALEIVGRYSEIYTQQADTSYVGYGDSVYYQKNLTFKRTIPLDKLTTKSLSVNGTAINNYYTGINDFYNVLPAQEIIYKVNTANSTMYYKGVNKQVLYIKKNSTSLTFIFDSYSSDTFSCDGSTYEISEFASMTGWGEIYGTLQIMLEERGVVIDSILPFKDSSNNIVSTIGSTASPFYKITASKLELDMPSSMTSNTHEGRYVVMPNGLIIQWGTEYVGSNGSETHHFPISFTTNASITCGAAWNNSDGWAVGDVYVRDINYYQVQNVNNSGANIHWIAVGY